MNESYIRMSGSPFFVHSPPGPRNVGMPLSADIPAPTSAMACRERASIWAASSKARRSSSPMAMARPMLVSDRPALATADGAGGHAQDLRLRQERRLERG